MIYEQMEFEKQLVILNRCIFMHSVPESKPNTLGLIRNGDTL